MYRRIVYKRKETIDPSWVWFIHNNLYINNINSNSDQYDKTWNVLEKDPNVF